MQFRKAARHLYLPRGIRAERSYRSAGGRRIRALAHTSDVMAWKRATGGRTYA